MNVSVKKVWGLALIVSLGLVAGCNKDDEEADGQDASNCSAVLIRQFPVMPDLMKVGNLFSGDQLRLTYSDSAISAVQTTAAYDLVPSELEDGFVLASEYNGGVNISENARYTYDSEKRVSQVSRNYSFSGYSSRDTLIYKYNGENILPDSVYHSNHATSIISYGLSDHRRVRKWLVLAHNNQYVNSIQVFESSSHNDTAFSAYSHKYNYIISYSSILNPLRVQLQHTPQLMGCFSPVCFTTLLPQRVEFVPVTAGGQWGEFFWEWPQTNDCNYPTGVIQSREIEYY
jgi:hypothetical protein